MFLGWVFFSSRAWNSTGIFPTSSHKVDNIDERMTWNGKNKDAGVVIRRAVTYVTVPTVLLVAGLQHVPSHVPFAGAGYLYQYFIRSFPTQNLPFGRTVHNWICQISDLQWAFAAGKRVFPDRWRWVFSCSYFGITFVHRYFVVTNAAN